MKKALMLATVCVALGVASAPSSAQSAKPAGRFEMRDQSSRGLRQAAEQGLRKLVFDFGRDVPASGKLANDFPISVSNYAELRQVTLGAGFEVHTIDPAQLLYAGKQSDLSRMTRSTGLWRFLVLSKGQPVALMDMEQVNGRWAVRGVGASALARDIQAKAQANAQSGSFKFVRIYQAGTDLMEVRGAGNSARFVTMMSAGGSSARAKSAAGVQATTQDLLPSLQLAVRRGLAHR